MKPNECEDDLKVIRNHTSNHGNEEPEVERNLRFQIFLQRAIEAAVAMQEYRRYLGDPEGYRPNYMYQFGELVGTISTEDLEVYDQVLSPLVDDSEPKLSL